MRIAMVGIVGLGLALSGCATIVKGTSQSISVSSPPASGAQCTLTNSQGTWYVTTPGNAEVHKTKTDLTIACKKDGFADATKTITPDFNKTTFANVIAGGIIGVGVDAASGANYEYPQSIEVPMTAATAAAPAAPAAPAQPSAKPSS
jgi:uncharacterized protein YceK